MIFATFLTALFHCLQYVLDKLMGLLFVALFHALARRCHGAQPRRAATRWHRQQGDAEDADASLAVDINNRGRVIEAGVRK